MKSRSKVNKVRCHELELSELFAGLFKTEAYKANAVLISDGVLHSPKNSVYLSPGFHAVATSQSLVL
ncbi:uncharacterized protein PHALS_09649 [Plasmopara halstedii]|uniref:Uncharacterized protein n=1 Tax=Plasmopara halstedii TaxID=4781 RepID=A0A0P1AEB7_PLAHL|nr:uncharacterized protein PHALS_09649 [Plasmopara halstedii]CEG39398.1 hypothetical protein PHALS_09649 [Plasmopara halstedii]|eukprot:XP_024575767.1 hypothetical protein PHALS_09649 [Plasmopara halstedii]